VKKGWYWPVVVVGLLGAGVGANVYFMVRAVGDPSFAVEPDYYAKAMAWDAHQAQAKENADLGWTLALTVAAADRETGRALVVAKLADPAGRKVSGLSVGLTAFHNARAADVVKARLAETAGHDYAAEVAILRPGLWEFRIVAERGAQTFTAVVDQDAPGALP
jgi:nitrogen fixation protein FixH